MCGRFALGYDADEVVAYFGAQQAALQSDSEGEEEEEPRAASAEAEQQPVASGSGAGRRVHWASEEAKEGYRPRYNVRSCVAGLRGTLIMGHRTGRSSVPLRRYSQAPWCGGVRSRSHGASLPHEKRGGADAPAAEMGPCTQLDQEAAREASEHLQRSRRQRLVGEGHVGRVAQQALCDRRARVRCSLPRKPRN